MSACGAVQQWGDDGGDHSGSSDGRGSSYFSGERVQRDKSSSASPLAQEDAPADRGAATQQVLICLILIIYRCPLSSPRFYWVQRPHDQG